MQKPLDPLGFKQNRYERPNQEWICGRAAEGTPCPLGPDKHGHCRATGQCIPAQKDDRWFCTRSEADGGKCEEGPLPRGACSHPIAPCQPVRSLRRLRGVLVWIFLALTTGCLLLFLGTASRRKWINPGELTNSHATSTAKCSDCHSLDVGNHLVIAALRSTGKRARADSALCLNCHTLGDRPLNSHGVGPAALVGLDEKLRKQAHSTSSPVLLRISRKLSGFDPHSAETDCIACHQEHHGRGFDLKRVSNSQCQTCHSVQFASFGEGHPDFSDYPYRRRTPIFFDHNSHLDQHFPATKEKAPQSCQACHETDPSGRFMLVKNFDVTCAACHGAQIQGEGMPVKGVAFFTVPGLDVETLAAKGISVGEWPKFADAKITPFMELLLNREPVTREALQALRGVDLLDLSKAAPGQLIAAEQLAWAVKNLLFNLVVEGQAYLLDQLKSQMPAGGQLMPAGLSGEMSRAVLLAAQKQWMPNLLAEVPNYRKGIKPPLPKRAQPTPAASPAASPPKPTGGDESLLGGENSAAGDLLAASPTPNESKTKNEDLTGGDLLEPSPGKVTQTATPSPPPSTPAPAEPKQPEEWTVAGGWYRPPESFTIFYRPSGHADPFFMAWLTVAAQMNRTDPHAHNVFQKLADPQAPGMCMKCHTADRQNSTITINWRPTHTEPSMHSFTVFKHTSHFSLIGDQGCQTCHSLNPASEYAKYFRSDNSSEPKLDLRQFQSNFKPMARARCAECHKPKVAGDSCLLCHRYHTGTFAEKLAGERKMQAASGKNSEALDKSD
jgi:hypothetical protein